jgi:hypothetical protein
MPDALEEFTRETIDRVLKEIPLEKRLEGLSPAQRLQGLALEDRLAGLCPEEYKALLRLLKDNGSAVKAE